MIAIETELHQKSASTWSLDGRGPSSTQGVIAGMASPPTQLLRLLESLALHDTSGKVSKYPPHWCYWSARSTLVLRNGTRSVLNCERNEVALLEFVYKRFERQREFTSTVHGGYFTKVWFVLSCIVLKPYLCTFNTSTAPFTSART